MPLRLKAGLVSITGTADDADKTGIPTADSAAGMYCSQAVLAAPLRRERTGEGVIIDVGHCRAPAPSGAGRWRPETENGAVEALLPAATFADVEAPMGAVPALGAQIAAVLREAGLVPRI